MDDFPLLTAAQMREIEALAINSGAVTAKELMETAGRSVWAAIQAKWPRLAQSPARALVLCGPGNNGGDGYVIARLLAHAGWQVDLVQTAPPKGEAAQAMAQKWVGLGKQFSAGGFSALGRQMSDYALVIDAIFGSGLTRPFRILRDLRRDLAARRPDTPYVVAVDVPSGLCADSGRVLGASNLDDALRADLTVTFEAPFLGHVLDHGPQVCGQIVVASLGRSVAAARAEYGGLFAQISASKGQALAKSPTGHKFRHGHCVVLSGPLGSGGAAQLAARAALRIGAGVVTVGCPQDALLEHSLGPTAALMQRVIEDAGDLTQAVSDPRVTCVCLGPGLGQDQRAVNLVEAALSARTPAVLDADALRLLARSDDFRRSLHTNCVLTPHEGEFAALCPQIAQRLAAPADNAPVYSRVQAAQDAAQALGAVVLLKGPATVIAEPDGAVAVHGGAHRAAPDLATAGSGDVLAGLIAGLVARGWEPFKAASDATWIHGDLARRFGPGLIADDLVDSVPAVLQDLIEKTNG